MPHSLARRTSGAVVVTIGAALVVGLAGAGPAQAATDTAPPVVTAVAFNPTSVDDTTADGDTTLTLHVTDASGLNGASLTLASSTTTLAPITFNNSSRTAGTSTKGDFSVDVDIPQGAAPGSYVPSITATDTKNNTGTTTVPAAALTITRATDTTPPSLVGGITTTPTTVDLTSGAQTVTMSARLTDAVAGVADAAITLTSPAGTTTTLPLTRTAGTAADGTWSADQYLPTSAPRGTWTLGTLSAHDAFGNPLSLTSGLGGFTATGVVDTVGPALVSVTPASASADTTSGPADVGLSVHATDDASGLDEGVLTFTSPDGEHAVTTSFGHAPRAGTGTDGTWRTTVRFPARSTAGDWTLTSADLFDAQGNESWYGDGSTAPPGADVEIGVHGDHTPPAVSSLTLGPAQVTTAYDDGTAVVDGQVHVSDDVSGVDTVDIALRGPDGTVDPADNLLADAGDLSSGSDTDGTLSFAGPIAGAADGTWTVDSVTVTDHAGNSTVVSGASLGSPSFTVVDTATDVSAPQLTGLSFGRSTAAPGDDVTVGVDGTDPGSGASGVEQGTLLLQPPTGDPVEFDLDGAPVRGDGVTGRFAATQTLAADAPLGTWTVASLTLIDRAGNTSTYAGGQLASALGTAAPSLVVSAGSGSGSGSGGTAGGSAPTAPHAPTSVRAVVASGSAKVSFTAPDNGGSAITSYLVVASPGGSACVTATTSCTVSGLHNGTSYTFAVSAINAVGTSHASTPSAAVVPRANTALSLARTAGSVHSGSAARVGGTLTRTDKAPKIVIVAGQLVRLQYRKAGSTGAWTTFGTSARTTSTGTATFTTLRPRYSIQVRLYFPTTGGYAGSVSAMRTISVVR